MLWNSTPIVINQINEQIKQNQNPSPSPIIIRNNKDNHGFINPKNSQNLTRQLINYDEINSINSNVEISTNTEKQDTATGIDNSRVKGNPQSQEHK